MQRHNQLAHVLTAALLAASCGGGAQKLLDHGSAAAPARGTLLQSPPSLFSTLTAPQLLLQLNLATNSQLLALSGAPLCDVLTYTIDYETVGARNEATTASAAMMVPAGVGANCAGSRPMVLYAHGTTTDRQFNMNNTANTESLFLAAYFASHGYVVVAPNYAGYDTSTLPYHPYLIADAESKDLIDALTAARTALPLASATLTKDNGQLFITGYSQGGYVAMATQRAMQSAGMTVTAAAPMSGPYAIAAFVDAVFYGQVNGGAPISSTLLLTAYQKAYGNVYSSPSDVFESRYATGIESLLPTTTPRSQLYAQGKLPEQALFNVTPPVSAYAAITPATMPANLAAVFALGFGANNLLTNSFRLAYLQDAQAHPDGGFPTLTTRVPAASPTLGWRQDLARNDLRDWTPNSPSLLCGGANDPLVFWLNTQLMLDYWASLATPPPSVSLLDLESAQPAGDPYATFKQDFGLAKDALALRAIAQGATDGGALAVAQAYHTELVAPFCFAAVKKFFSAF